MRLKIFSQAAGSLERTRKGVADLFWWSLIWLVACGATVGGATAVYGFLFELYYFLRYGNWPLAIDLLMSTASLSGKADDVFRWVMELDWAGLKWLLLHWPLSAVGLGTALVMLLLAFIISAWMED